AADRVDPGDLAGVGDGGEAAVAGDREGGRVGLRRELRLGAAEPEAKYAALAVGDRHPGGFLGRLEREAARDVGGQAHLDPVHLARLLGAVAVALEDLLPGGPVGDRAGGAED